MTAPIQYNMFISIRAVSFLKSPKNSHASRKRVSAYIVQRSFLTTRCLSSSSYSSIVSLRRVRYQLLHFLTLHYQYFASDHAMSTAYKFSHQSMPSNQWQWLKYNMHRHYANLATLIPAVSSNNYATILHQNGILAGFFGVLLML